jgi:hypothetical protein
MPANSISYNKIRNKSIKRSTIRSTRSRVIDLIPLNQTILVELTTEEKND